MHSMPNSLSRSPDPSQSRPKRVLISLALAFALMTPVIFSVNAASDTPQPGPALTVVSPPVAIARGRVEVQGGMHELVGQAGEVVRRIHVAEGDRVRAGTPLIEIDRARQAYQRDIALAEQQQARSEFDALAGRLPYEKARLKRLQSAAALGGMEAQRLADGDESLRALQASMATAKRVMQAAEKRAALANWEFERRVLRAEADGVVMRIHARVGGESAPARPLLTLLPDAPLVVRAEIGANFAPRVQPGMRAQVVMDGQNDGPVVDAQVAIVSAAYIDSGFGEGSVRAATRVVESIVPLPEGSGLHVGQLVRVKFHE
ncbi:MAG: HlyD family efflux transporter periplasmic adaptor subunit [Burkholderiaceae bacterium]